MKTMLVGCMVLLTMGKAVADKPVIHSPRDGQRIGGAGDDACPATKKNCWKISATGTVGADRIGIFAVEPLEASPDIWIQSFSPTASGGPVKATIRLGEVHAGADEDFRIYLLSCREKHGFQRNQITSIERMRSACDVSAPVTVHRER